jgi:putative hydrolase of the HAD superfamily
LVDDGQPPAFDRERRTAGPIRAVLFDAGATLIHPDPPVEEVYAREFSDGRLRFAPEELSRALARVWEQVHAENAKDRYGGVRGEPDFWREFLNRVRSLLDGGEVSARTFARLATHFADPASWAVYGDVRPALEALTERGFRLAVVSNWDSRLPGLLEGLGLASSFQSVSVSAIEETGKPEPEIFRRTCARLRVSPGEALHVGDSVREDFDGARGAGLAALLLDREDQFPDRPLRVRSLREVLPRIEVLG